MTERETVTDAISEEAVEAGARAIAVAEGDHYPPDRFDNIQSWANESDESMKARCKRRGGVLSTQRDNRDSCRDQIARWRAQSRAALSAALPIVVAGEKEKLVAALEPFANAAANWDGERYPMASEMEDDPASAIWRDDEPLYEPTVYMITVGDLRRARAAIRADKGGETPDG